MNYPTEKIDQFNYTELYSTSKHEIEKMIDAAKAGGYPEEARHLEYFTLPEEPDYVNHAFTLRLAKSGRDVPVAANEVATDAPTSAKCFENPGDI